MAKLYATLETSKGKTVSVSDNEEIIATVYDGNMKAYSVHIEWCDVGDGEMGAIITTREWRNEPEERRKKGKIRVISDAEHSKEYLEGEALDNNLDESAKATGKICYIEHKSGQYGGCSIPHIRD